MLKTFSVPGFINGNQVDLIVACKTKKKASEILESYGISYGYLSNYGTITGNKNTIEVANSKIETVFASSKIGLYDFTEVIN